MLRAAEVVDDAVRLAYPIWVDLLGDVGRASGDAEHSAQVGENEPRLAIDHDDAHLIVTPQSLCTSREHGVVNNERPRAATDTPCGCTRRFPH